MIKFSRYPHINELLMHYAEQEKRDDVKSLLQDGVKGEDDAEVLSRVVWRVAELINNDEENATEVLGSIDNTEMLPDLSYEISAYMKAVGYYSVWQRVSDQEFNN